MTKCPKCGGKMVARDRYESKRKLRFTMRRFRRKYSRCTGCAHVEDIRIEADQVYT